MITFLICLIIYLIGVLNFYRFIRKAHSKGGRWENLTPNLTDITFMFIPVINLIISFNRAGKEESDLTKFFAIKK